VISRCPNTANLDFMDISNMFSISCGFSLPKYGKLCMLQLPLM
jgi:hypothetical protein